MNARESAFGQFVFTNSSPGERIIEIATAILTGDLGAIEGARLLACQRLRISLGEDDPDFLPFISIEHHTDHLPVGHARRLWRRDALSDKDLEIAVAEDNLRDEIMPACMRLIQRFGPPSFADGFHEFR
jgi:hypothetical protein